MQLDGYKVRIVPESVVYHIGGGTLPQTSPWKLKLNYRNNLMLLENNLPETYALEMLRKKIRAGKRYEDIDLEDIGKRAARRAERRIFWRMVVDGCTAAAYLLMLKLDLFKAVLQAHGEFKKLSRKWSPYDVEQYLASIAGPEDGYFDENSMPEVRGIYGHWIIPRAIFLGQRAFAAVRKYF